MRSIRRLAWFPVFLCVLGLAACGGDSPVGPSGAPQAQGVLLRGSVLGAAAALDVGAASGAAAAGAVTVTVQENPAITTTVAADGTFTLRGLPAGSFTLIFSRDGAPLGTLAFSEVKPNQEITITVSVAGGSVVLMEERRDGIGNGDVEIEGLVDAVQSLNPAGDSRFLIDGRVVIARPGQTAIREGNAARGVADVTAGRRVHVKGVWQTPEGTTQPVLALEIKLQGPQQTPGTPGTGSCMINGGRAGDRIELEGQVAGGNAASFMLQVQGNRASGPVQVNGAGASFECTPRSGPNAPTAEQCRASVTGGAKVHVSGRLDRCDAGSALVTASRVSVQK